MERSKTKEYLQEFDDLSATSPRRKNHHFGKGSPAAISPRQKPDRSRTLDNPHKLLRNIRFMTPLDFVKSKSKIQIEDKIQTMLDAKN